MSSATSNIEIYKSCRLLKDKNFALDGPVVGYDYVSSNGEIISSLPMNSDHTDEIIYCKLKKDYPYQLILASGNEGMNIVNLKGEVLKHNNIDHEIFYLYDLLHTP